METRPFSPPLLGPGNEASVCVCVCMYVCVSSYALTQITHTILQHMSTCSLYRPCILIEAVKLQWSTTHQCTQCQCCSVIPTCLSSLNPVGKRLESSIRKILNCTWATAWSSEKGEKGGTLHRQSAAERASPSSRQLFGLPTRLYLTTVT